MLNCRDASQSYHCESTKDIRNDIVGKISIRRLIGRLRSLSRRARDGDPRSTRLRVAIGNVPATPVVDPVQPAEMWIATSPPRGLVEGMSSESMTDFLQSGAVIDCTDPTIVAAAAEIAGDAMDDEEIAKRYFLWVRDSVQHSSDGNNPVVTCAASAVLKHRAGFCYAKSHLLVALLRARGIPAALCYQRLAFDDSGSAFFLHGLVAIHLQRHGWYRVDPRGNKPGVFSDFSPPVECLPYAPTLAGEQDVPGRFAEPLACVISTLERWPTASDVRANLPDYSSESTPPSVSGTR